MINGSVLPLLPLLLPSLPLLDLILLRDKLTHLRINPTLHFGLLASLKALLAFVAEGLLKQIRFLPRSIYLAPIRRATILRRDAKLAIKSIDTLRGT